jgi:hypothetical protein
MSLLDTVQQHLGPEQIQQISQHLGIDPTTANNAVQAALPMMVSGMAAHAAQQPEGASAIESAVQSHSPADMLGGFGNIGGMLSGAMSGAGGGILGSILGRHADTVQNGVQTNTGLDSSKVKALLVMLAPLVISAIAKHQATQPSDSQGGIGSILQQAASAAQQNSTSPQAGGVLGQILGKL